MILFFFFFKLDGNFKSKSVPDSIDIPSSNSKDLDLEKDVYSFEVIEGIICENKCVKWKIYDNSEVILKFEKITSE